MTAQHEFTFNDGGHKLTVIVTLQRGSLTVHVWDDKLRKDAPPITELKLQLPKDTGP